MTKYITFALVLFASVAIGYCVPVALPYGSGVPAVQQVSLRSLSGIANIHKYLDTAPASSSSSAASSAAAPSAQVIAQPAYAAPHAPAYAPAQSVVLPAPSPVYGAAPGYAAAPRYGHPAPRYNVIQPAVATQLNPGQLNYKAIQGVPQYNTVALPVVPSEAVAKLYVPRPAPAPYNIGPAY
ncbi:chorion protein S19 [Teleopsis dalmanni]|uniref:chorion protein S19 n=1 Tax=Teleopsis dalmanni TaxID=139649 RepID=UPI000D32CABD|nr:chorion protein S19 [Teleopsis dalmanni]